MTALRFYWLVNKEIRTTKLDVRTSSGVTITVRTLAMEYRRRLMHSEAAGMPTDTPRVILVAARNWNARLENAR